MSFSARFIVDHVDEHGATDQQTSPAVYQVVLKPLPGDPALLIDDPNLSPHSRIDMTIRADAFQQNPFHHGQIYEVAFNRTD